MTPERREGRWAPPAVRQVQVRRRAADRRGPFGAPARNVPSLQCLGELLENPRQLNLAPRTAPASATRGG